MTEKRVINSQCEFNWVVCKPTVKF